MKCLNLPRLFSKDSFEILKLREASLITRLLRRKACLKKPVKRSVRNCLFTMCRMRRCTAGLNLNTARISFDIYWIGFLLKKLENSNRHQFATTFITPQALKACLTLSTALRTYLQYCKHSQKVMFPVKLSLDVLIHTIF